MSIDVIFLGLDGVLFDTEALRLEAFNMAFSQAGLLLRWEMSEMRKALRIYGTAGVMAALAKVQDSRHPRELAAELTRLKQRAMQQLVMRAKPAVLPAAAHLIDDALHAGCKLSILSETSAATTAALLEQCFGDTVNSKFAVVAGGVKWQGTAATGPYALALHAMGIEARNAVAIDTSPDALRAARGCGLLTISACPNDINDASISGADLWCPQLQELRKIVPNEKPFVSFDALRGMKMNARRMTLPIAAQSAV
ncbi:MAG: HAD family hydrolase [Pseudomonadota bacterium]